MSEAQEQEALFAWASTIMSRHPELRWMMHIPNGGGRNAREGRALKKRGVRAGVADIFLPAMRHGYGGLWIELKCAGGKASATQNDFLRDMRNLGYRAEICVGWESASNVIKNYLLRQKPQKKRGQKKS